MTVSSSCPHQQVDTPPPLEKTTPSPKMSYSSDVSSTEEHPVASTNPEMGQKDRELTIRQTHRILKVLRAKRRSLFSQRAVAKHRLTVSQQQLRLFKVQAQLAKDRIKESRAVLLGLKGEVEDVEGEIGDVDVLVTRNLLTLESLGGADIPSSSDSESTELEDEFGEASIPIDVEDGGIEIRDGSSNGSDGGEMRIGAFEQTNIPNKYLTDWAREVTGIPAATESIQDVSLSQA